MHHNPKILVTTAPCSAMVVKVLVLPRISNIEDHANTCITEARSTTHRRIAGC